MPRQEHPRRRRTVDDFANAFTALLLAAGLNPDKLSRELARQNQRGLVKRSTLYDWKNGQHLPEDDAVFLAIVRVCLNCAHRRGGHPPLSEDDLLALLIEARLSRGSRSELPGGKDRHTAVDRRRDRELARVEQDGAAARTRWDAISEPLAKGPPSGPAGWLRPDRAVVEFTGRETELAELRAWCKPEGTGQVRVLIGAGGVGKTRLALRVAAEWEAGGTEWRLVTAGEEAGAVAAARDVTSGPVLLIVDYAETRGGLPRLLRAVLDDPGIVRVLLVARSLGEWWDHLVEESPTAIGQMLHAAAPILLDARVTTDSSDAELVVAAVPYFCRVLKVEQPGQIEFELPATRVPILVLHAAALVAVLRFQSDPAASLRMVVGMGVLDELLRHEARYWRRTARAAGLPAEGPLIKPVVAAAGLIGARGLAEAAKLVARVPDLADISIGQQRRWARWLYDLYPAGMDGKLGSLQPDLLAEIHVVGQLAGDRDLAESCLTGLSEDQAAHALTVLARACAHQDRAQELIAAALHEDLAHLAMAAARVALQTSGDLGVLLADALRDAPISPELLADISMKLPYPSVVLAEAKVNSALRARASLSADGPTEKAAAWNNYTGYLLLQLGRPMEALPLIQEAVSAYRELAKTVPDVHRRNLAHSLHNLGMVYGRLGRRSDALPAKEEAVAIHRELAEAIPDRYRGDFATSLDNLGVEYYELGRLPEALAAAEEAVSAYRELAGEMRDRYRPNLAHSLNNLGLWYSQLGRSLDALLPAQEAVAIRRELAENAPDSYLPDLASSLELLGILYSRVDRLEEALAVTEEAVDVYREIAGVMPDRYRPHLAQSLDNLGIWYAQIGRPGDALPLMQQGLAIRRELAETMPVRYRPELAHSLHNLGKLYSALDRPNDALPLMQRAVNIRTELAVTMPARYLPDLARSVHNLGSVHAELGHLEYALPLMRQAVGIRSKLAEDLPDRYEHELNESLGILVGIMQDLGQLPPRSQG